MKAPWPEVSAGFRFAVNDLDRRADLREDAAAIEALFADPRARVLVVSGREVAVRRDGDGHPRAALDRAEAIAIAGTDAEAVFLGLVGEVGWFALAGPAAAPEAPAAAWEAIDLRTLAIAGSLPAPQYGALATARALLHWHAGHAFCSRCGSSSRMAAAGWKRLCPACGAEHFPRTDPVVIMSVERGDRCLLGRSAHFPEGMWSCLAGFMEPGETIEAAVRREVLEESGILVGAVAYAASEPWPFPGSLMIGVRADAQSDTIRIDPAELTGCRWFDRDEVRAMLEGRHPEGLFAPPPIAIARHLIAAFAQVS
jgi:NAD+ diphosphatase